jgi:hypothetical protein
LEPWRIPKPYNTYQADAVDNRSAVLAAVRRVAGEPPKLEAKPSPGLSEATVREALALEHWQAIKTSADPASLRSFLNDFGETKCASLAQIELKRISFGEPENASQLPLSSGGERIFGIFIALGLFGLGIYMIDHYNGLVVQMLNKFLGWLCPTCA